MKIGLSEYEEGVADGREESEEIIRQQQAEIEVLKQQLVTTSSEAKLNYNKGHEDGHKLAVVKQITDEEILHQNLIWGQQNGEDYSMLTVEDIEPLISLIRAILRKESERWTKNEYEPPDFFFMENDLMGKR